MAANQYNFTEKDVAQTFQGLPLAQKQMETFVKSYTSLLGAQSEQPATNAALEKQIEEVKALAEEAIVAIQGIKVPVWKMQVFDSSGTFTVPETIAGSVVYVTGSGGGGSGAAWINSSANFSIGGACSGCYIEKQPFTVNAGDSIPVTIGAGGAAVSANSITASPVYGNAGQSSSFGSLTINGGSGGGEAAANTGQPRQGGWIGGYQAGSTVFAAENSIRHRAGLRQTAGTAYALQAAAGAFGDGADGVASSGSPVTAGSALPNTGAAGGGAVFFTSAPPTITITSGAGGSGKIIVEWQEFV